MAKAKGFLLYIYPYMSLKGKIIQRTEELMTDAAVDAATKLTDRLIVNWEKLYLYYKWVKYSMVRKRTEAFFERGSLYQYMLATDLPLYSTEDTKFAIEEAERRDFHPFLLKKALKFLKKDDVFMLVEIRRFRFDYSLLKVLVGDQIHGIILYNHMATYPWELFKVLEE